MKGSARHILTSLATWIAIASLWAADGLIKIMLFVRANERRIRPTERVAWPKGLKQRLMRRQGNTCMYCGYRRTAASMDIDHIIPVVRGGSNNEDNLQVICRPCNQRKGLQTDEEFRSRYSRLVPRRQLTPPSRRISQKEFRDETQRTRQGESVQHFRRTRFISNREKVITGCIVLGVVVAISLFLALSEAGVNPDLVLWPSVIVGGAVGVGVWFRAYRTGAMIEGDD